MVRTIATTSLAFILQTAVAARADYPHARTNPTLCEETSPLGWSNGRGGIYRDGVGREGTTGPTFPSVCRQGAMMHPTDDPDLAHGPTALSTPAIRP
jgi:hypothetical protein